MSRQPIERNYVSEMDQLLNDFNQTHPVLTLSQQKECNKYHRIYRLRDNSVRALQQPSKIWEGF